MALLSPDQVLAARIRNSKLVTIEELGGVKLRIVKVSGTAANRSGELLEQRNAGKITMQDFMLEMFQHTLATEDGKLLDKASAQQVLDLLPMDATLKMLTEIEQSVPKPETIAGNSKGSPADA